MVGRASVPASLADPPPPTCIRKATVLASHSFFKVINVKIMRFFGEEGAFDSTPCSPKPIFTRNCAALVPLRTVKVKVATPFILRIFRFDNAGVAEREQ